MLTELFQYDDKTNTAQYRSLSVNIHLGKCDRRAKSGGITSY